jgi:hypothetical protein
MQVKKELELSNSPRKNSSLIKKNTNSSYVRLETPVAVPITEVKEIAEL